MRQSRPNITVGPAYGHPSLLLLYARDLHQAGYRYGDVVRVYALNLLLVPINWPA